MFSDNTNTMVHVNRGKYTVICFKSPVINFNAK